MCKLRRISPAAVLFLFALPVRAQIYEFRGGSSSLYDAYGGTLNVYTSNYSGALSLGFLGTPRIGFLVETNAYNFRWSIGDQMLPFVLPTDHLNQIYSFLGRGVGISRKNKEKQSSLLLFAGETSSSFVVPFLSVARGETPAALVLYQRQLRPTLRFTSHNLFSSRQTSIQSLEWQPRSDTKLACAAGVGSNQGYGATSLDWKRSWISVLASYTLAGRDFRRVQMTNPLGVESDRENVQIDLVPIRNLRFIVSRQNLLAPLSRSKNIRAAVNGAGAEASFAGFQFRASLFSSTSAGQKARAFTLGGGRSFSRYVTASLDYFRSAPAGGPPGSNYLISLRENLTRRISVSELISHGGGQTSIAYGGRLVTNLLSFDAQYQTIYLPFAGASQSVFKQVLSLMVRAQLPWNLALEGSTTVNVLGQVRYNAFATAYAYGAGSEGDLGVSARAFGKYIIRGQVLDQTGQPVSGAALEIGGELIFTDSQGCFFLREKKAKAFPLRVLLDQFMDPGRYEVASAPSAVESAPEATAQAYRIELRRRPFADPVHPTTSEPPPETEATPR